MIRGLIFGDNRRVLLCSFFATKGGHTWGKAESLKQFQQLGQLLTINTRGSDRDGGTFVSEASLSTALCLACQAVAKGGKREKDIKRMSGDPVKD